MKDAEIEEKIEELMLESSDVAGYQYSEDHVEGMLREAVLFGQERMREKAIACVPEEKELSFTGNIMHDTLNNDELKGFNYFRTQALSALSEL